MSPRRGGWDYAQIRSSFLSDPEFQRLTRSCRSDRDFYAAVGLWTIAVAQAWREDRDDVGDVLDNYPRGAVHLREAELIHDERFLVGFSKWTENVRRIRQQDSERKRGVPMTPAESGGLPRTPEEFPRGDGDGVVVKETTPKPPRRGLRSGGRSPRQLREGSPEIDRRTLQHIGDLLP